MKKALLTICILFVSVILFTSCNYVVISNEDYNALMSAVKETSIVYVSESSTSSTAKSEEVVKEESVVVYKPTENFCTKVVKMFMEDFYTFSPVSDDIKAKDIVWAWNNTEGRLTIQFKDYVVGRKVRDVDIIVCQLADEDQAYRLATLVNCENDEWQAANDMLRDKFAKSYGDVVVISTRELVGKVDKLVENA